MTKYSVLLLALSTILISCDKVDNPVLENPNVNPTSGVLEWEYCPGLVPADYVFPDFAPITSSAKNVLLEDYTGHTCANCPPAAVSAQNLESEYPGRINVVSIHAGIGNGFQAVDDEHPTDFTTEAGDAYVIFPDPQCFGNPSGSINRVTGGFQDGIWYFLPDWDAVVAQEIVEDTRANIGLEYYHCPDGNGLFVHSALEVEDTFSEDADYRFILYLIRQEVISPQSYPAFTDEDYHHHNVLSDNINGTWGTQISLDTLAVEEQLLLNFSYQLPDPMDDETYDVENLALVGYLMDRNTQQVFQSVFLELE